MHSFRNFLRPLITLSPRFSFSGLPSSFFRNDFDQHLQIISLSQSELSQLATLNSYTASVTHLEKNSLDDSLLQLQYALAEAKDKYPWSINLHACLMNRQSILLKLLSRKRQFEDRLQSLYLITLSANGPRNLDTIKNLVNYLICLTIYNSKKCHSVLEFLKSNGALPEYLLFFDALSDIKQRNARQEGLKKLERLPEQAAYEKIFKYNNLAYMSLYCLRKQHPAAYQSQLKSKSQQLLSLFLRALMEAENNPTNVLNYTPEQLQQIEDLQKHITAYVNKQKTTLPTGAHAEKKILKNANSHIISMNISALLFDLQRTNECFYFLQLSLERAMGLGQLERVGIALILLGRCYYLQGQEKWQSVYLDLLHHSKSYPKSIIKEALSVYSHLLFQEGRLYEAEAYLNQAIAIEVEEGLEGLILPSYDFSF